MALRVCVTALIVAMLATSVVGTKVYTKVTTIPGGTVAVPVTDTVSPTALPTWKTHRDCLISPTTVVPQSPANATVSVQAGYHGTVGGTEVCCGYFGFIDTSSGNCMHNVCQYTNFEQLAAWGYDYYNGIDATLNSGTLVPQSAGSSFFFASTSTSFTHLCFPVSQCFESTGSTISNEPYTHNATYTSNGPTGAGYSNDTFFSRAGTASVTIAVSAYRTAWMQFLADFTVFNVNPALSSPAEQTYVIPAGVYSAYEITTSSPFPVCVKKPTTTCNTAPIQSKIWVCKDRGITDDVVCTLPCGTQLTSFFKDDINIFSGPDPYNGNLSNIRFCYANCIIKQ